jgi:surface polysaccharide O-acyltransferase-like enzyme
MLSVFIYHSDRFFNFASWHLKNDTTILASTIHTEFFQYWMMPLFFIISGASVYFSLKHRSAGSFAGERSLRILIPWLVLGLLIIAPPQIYLMRVAQGEFAGNFFQFYPHFFEGVYPMGGNFAFHGMHLWYLMDLFIFSMLLLPLFKFGKKSGKSVLSRFARLFSSPWALLPLFILVAGVSLLADNAYLDVTRVMGGWDVLSYIVFFVLGYVLFANPRIQDSIRKLFPATLVAAAVFTAMAMYISLGVKPAASNTVWLGTTTLRALCAWLWVFAILGIGQRYLNFNSRFLAYANEGVLPFYIMHQTVITIVGFYVIQWDMAIGAKFGIIAVLSFISIMVIYELLVRRLGVLRFLFGMKPRRRKAVYQPSRESSRRRAEAEPSSSAV